MFIHENIPGCPALIFPLPRWEGTGEGDKLKRPSPPPQSSPISAFVATSAK
jgi:hypothetical protein